MKDSFTENASGFFGASGVSAPTYGRAEDVRVVPVVVPELEFRDVQRQIFTEETMTDPSDIFSRTRALIGELSAAILGAAGRNIGIERARTECDLRGMQRSSDELGRLLSQALQMQMVLAAQLKKPRFSHTFCSQCGEQFGPGAQWGKNRR